MQIYTDLEDIMAQSQGRKSITLLDEKNGCVAGCRSGITIYDETEYGKGGIHEDQEGFFVLEGRGLALIDGEELEMEPGMAFMIPAGVEHTMKRAPGSEYCKVLWFHGAI